MTGNKAAKRAIRARMAKTGERYTAARRHLFPAADPVPDLAEIVALDGAGSVAPPATAAPPTESAFTPETAADGTPASTSADVAWPAGEDVPEAGFRPRMLPPRLAEPDLGDAAIRRGSGRAWDEWFALLDDWGASERTHAEIARHVASAHGVDGWWAQGVTVGYERARGLRARHERPDGFSANVSKTLPVPAEAIHAAFVDEVVRDCWLEPGTLRLRTQQPARSARFDVSADGTRIQVFITAKDPGKSAVQVQHGRLTDAADVDERKAFWRERLARLASMMTADRSAAADGSRSPDRA